MHTISSGENFLHYATPTIRGDAAITLALVHIFHLNWLNQQLIKPNCFLSPIAILHIDVTRKRTFERAKNYVAISSIYRQGYSIIR